MRSIQQAVRRKRFGSWGLLATVLVSTVMEQAWAWYPSEVEVVWTHWAQSVYTREHIPHFALHPPVYYTMPVGRPYGYSPFAYPGWMPTPQFEPRRPMVIVNPYVVGPAGRSAASSEKYPAFSLAQVAAGEQKTFCALETLPAEMPRPVRIANPYCMDPAQKGTAESTPSKTEEKPIFSTAAVQPRRIRNPYVAEKK